MANMSDVEHIEWDLPVSEMQKLSKESGQEGWMDFSKLSLGTEMRNKMWEEDHKDVIGTHNKNFLQNDSPPFPEHSLVNGKAQPDEQAQRGKAPHSFFNNLPAFDFSNRGSSVRNGFHVGNSLNPNSPSFSPAQLVSPGPEESGQLGANGRGEGRFGLSGSGNDLRVSWRLVLRINTLSSVHFLLYLIIVYE